MLDLLPMIKRALSPPLTSSQLWETTLVVKWAHLQSKKLNWRVASIRFSYGCFCEDFLDCFFISGSNPLWIVPAIRTVGLECTRRVTKHESRRTQWSGLLCSLCFKFLPDFSQWQTVTCKKYAKLLLVMVFHIGRKQIKMLPKFSKTGST